MKKLVIFTLLLTVCSGLFAQQDTVYLKKESKKFVVTDRQPQVFFAELGGPGIALSANYDRRVSKRTDGWGYRVGLGYSFSSGFEFTTIPVGVNYLMGDKTRGRFFEIGINGTLILLSEDSFGNDGFFSIDEVTSTKQSLFMTSLVLGYRSQPVRGGFSFRGGIMPVFAEGETGLGAYLSFGYNF